MHTHILVRRQVRQITMEQSTAAAQAAFAASWLGKVESVTVEVQPNGTPRKPQRRLLRRASYTDGRLWQWATVVVLTSTVHHCQTDQTPHEHHLGKTAYCLGSTSYCDTSHLAAAEAPFFEWGVPSNAVGSP